MKMLTKTIWATLEEPLAKLEQAEFDCLKWMKRLKFESAKLFT